MSVVTVGDFDGVHIGHRELLSSAVSLAESLAVPSVALTFDRNTKQALKGAVPYFLTSNEEKKERILAEGIDQVVFVTFNDAFRKMSAEDFLLYLKKHCGCTHLVGGSDFRFGHQGVGTLSDGAVLYGIQQHVVELKTDLVKISSSGIRTALGDGLVERANSWLGYPYSITGPVVEGKHLGRTIGFPTVNLAVPEGKTLPRDGVYVTETVLDGRVYRSVTNVGTRPTVEQGNSRNVETHLLNADGNFYGKIITVRFLARLRDEKRFSNLGELMQQLRSDRDSAYLWHNPEHFS